MDPLKQLQLDLAARLQSHPLFEKVPVLSRAKGDLSSDVENALGALISNVYGASGVLASVLMPIVDVPQANIPGPRCEIVATVFVVEAPSINATGISAEAAALSVLAALHQIRLRPEIEQIVSDKRALEPFDTGDDSLVAYSVYLRTSFTVSAPRKVVTPLITGAAAAVSIVTAYATDSDAEIYFTTDDSFPWSGNPAATKYTAPFAVTAGTRVRAGAFKTNQTPSDIASATIGA